MKAHGVYWLSGMLYAGRVCVCDQFLSEEQKVSFRHMYCPTDEPFERTDLQILAPGNLLVSAHVSS